MMAISCSELRSESPSRLPIEPSTDRAKLLTGGGIVGLDVLLADVIRT